jgi:FixJ family two-component response regulator
MPDQDDTDAVLRAYGDVYAAFYHQTQNVLEASAAGKLAACDVYAVRHPTLSGTEVGGRVADILDCHLAQEPAVLGESHRTGKSPAKKRPHRT